MNEIIAKLAEQAAQESALNENEVNLEVSFEDQTFQIPGTFIEAFAKLIAQECAGVTLDYKNEDHYAGWCDHASAILEQFEVNNED